MSAYSIAKEHLDRALAAATAEGIRPQDALHALLVTLVERYKTTQGMATTQAALDFQMRNLSDDEDYAFMRP
jgi:hypothetical protein